MRIKLATDFTDCADFDCIRNWCVFLFLFFLTKTEFILTNCGFKFEAVTIDSAFTKQTNQITNKMKTLSLTAAFAFLFFSATFAQAPKATAQKPATAQTTKTPAAKSSKPHAAKKTGTAKGQPTKSSGMRPSTNGSVKPTAAHSNSFAREHASKNIATGHKHHKKGGKKPAAK